MQDIVLNQSVVACLSKPEGRQRRRSAERFGCGCRRSAERFLEAKSAFRRSMAANVAVLPNNRERIPETDDSRRWIRWRIGRKGQPMERRRSASARGLFGRLRHRGGPGCYKKTSHSKGLTREGDVGGGAARQNEDASGGRVRPIGVPCEPGPVARFRRKTGRTATLPRRGVGKDGGTAGIFRQNGDVWASAVEPGGRLLNYDLNQ